MEVLPSYGKRLGRASNAEYKRFWTGYRIIVALAGLLPPLVLLLLRRAYSMLSMSEVIVSGAVGLCVALVGTYLHSRRQGAEALDRGWSEKRRQQELQSAKDAERIKQLEAEIAEQKKPKRSPLEQQQHEILKERLANYGRDEMAVLNHLAMVTTVSRRHNAELSPPVPQLLHEKTIDILKRLELDQMVISECQDIPGGWQETWRIAPGAIYTINQELPNVNSVNLRNST